jgi:ferredoxin
MTVGVVVDRDFCIGAASCLRLAPGVFALDAEGRAYVRADAGDEERIRMAAQACPSAAITIEERAGG